MMYKALCPYAIGVQVGTLEEAIRAAQFGRFQGVEVNPWEVADRVETQGAESVKALFADADIRPAAWGLTVEWRGSEESWREGLESLPRLARAAAAIGAKRVATWLLPGSDERDYAANYQFHIERFTPIAQILAEHSCSLGLEFIGPKTLRDSMRYPFVYQMEEMLKLGEKIGPNVGLLLDCWHWYTSGGTLEALHALQPAQVVYVHVNDAPTGIHRDEQKDEVRALPGETGVIAIADFLQALAQIGYDGPVTPEPFKKELGDLPFDESRLTMVGASLDKIFSQAGITPG
jgi:sugar phosphate isomerase/epimerase